MQATSPLGANAGDEMAPGPCCIVASVPSAVSRHSSTPLAPLTSAAIVLPSADTVN
jgi:hypothetical protein